MGLRRAVAQQAGVTEAMIASVGVADDAGGLDQHQAAALAVADAYLGTPVRMTGPERNRIVSQLGEERFAEIVLRLTLFSRNKVRVSLGLDEPEIRIRPY